MRPTSHHIHLQSVLLARSSTFLASKTTATATCTAAQRRAYIRTPINQPVPTASYDRYYTAPRRISLSIQNSNYPATIAKTRRLSSTISSNPPPPSTSDRARKTRGQTYTPPSTATENTAEQTPIPDPTTSYAAPVTSSNASTTTSKTNAGTLQPPPLTWNAFLALRRTRRHYNLFASITTSLLTTTASIPILTQQPLETMAIFNLDPFIVLGLSTFTFAALGWLLGPTVGNAAFNFVHRARRPEMEAKERDFFARIRKNRVDASGSSAGNPVPDYYGEKIGSVAGYRTWLRDQRAFNRRRQKFL